MVESSRGAIATIRERLRAALERPVACVDEAGAPTGNADGGNPEGRRGWQWVMVTPVVTVFLQGLSRSAAAAMELQRVVDLACERGERTPWAQTEHTCRQPLQCKQALWSFLERPGIEPTNNATERTLRQSVIHRRISHGVQSASGAICRSRLLTVTASLRQQGRAVGGFLEQAWNAHRLGGVMPSLMPDR